MSQRYRVDADDAATTLRVRVRAANGPVAETATSEPTNIVTAPDPHDEPEEPGEDPTAVPIGEPTITGVPLARATLTAHPGDTFGRQPIAWSYQWESCGHETGGCAPIDGATEPTFVPSDVLAGEQLRVGTTATFASETGSATSEPTAPIAGSPPPTSVQAPTLTVLGHPTVGTKVSTDGGQWSNADADARAYQWQRCHATCTDIDGATRRVYELTEDDLGHRLQVSVTVETASGSAEASSAPSSVVSGAVAGAAGQMVAVDIDHRTLLLGDADAMDPEALVSCFELTGAAPGEGCSLRRPRISPNGQMIAVEASSSGWDGLQTRIVVVNYDGSEPRTVTHGSDPAWTADSSALLYTAHDPSDPGRVRIERVAADGSDTESEVVVAGDLVTASAPDVSPDARTMTFVGRSQANAKAGLYVDSTDGTDISSA